MLNHVGLIITEVNHLVWICQTSIKRNTHFSALVLKNHVYLLSVCVNANVKKSNQKVENIHVSCSNSSSSICCVSSSQVTRDESRLGLFSLSPATDWWETSERWSGASDSSPSVAQTAASPSSYAGMKPVKDWSPAADSSTFDLAHRSQVKVFFLSENKNKLASWLQSEALSFIHELWNFCSWIIKSVGRATPCRLLPSVFLISTPTVQSNKQPAVWKVAAAFGENHRVWSQVEFLPASLSGWKQERGALIPAFCCFHPRQQGWKQPSSLSPGWSSGWATVARLLWGPSRRPLSSFWSPCFSRIPPSAHILVAPTQLFCRLSWCSSSTKRTPGVPQWHLLGSPV